MKIILDAMGGDHAPEAPVLGAFEAAKLYGAQITLVGRGEAILETMRKHGIADLPDGVDIANADDVVDMHDDPASVIHKRKNSSMVVGLKMLADGQGDAFVSAGSTGALLTGATLLVKRVKGIRRAAMGPAMPNKAGGKTVEEVKLFDVYRGKQVPEGKKSVAFNVTMRMPDRTMTDEDADKVAKKILTLLERELGLTLRA